jgi:hypothetical protein
MSVTIAVKLSNGEEWIGQHTQQLQDGSTLELIKPRRLQLVPTGKGGMGLALTPIFMCSQDLESVTVPTQHIVATIAVDRDFEKQYLQEVSSIQLI